MEDQRIILAIPYKDIAPPIPFGLVRRVAPNEETYYAEALVGWRLDGAGPGLILEKLIS